MRRAAKTLIFTAAVVTVGIAGTVVAYAGGWTVPDGRATLTAPVAKMPRGVEPSVARQGGRAVVSWSAREIVPGVRMDRYVVTAHSADAPPRPDVTRTVTAGGGATESVVFPAAAVTGGRWSWTITPRYRLWTGAESPQSRRLAFPAGAEEAPVGAVAPAPAGTPRPDGTTPPAPAGKPSPTATVTEDAPADVPPPPSVTPATPPTEPAAGGSAPTGIPE
jgi:hypothetical protein